MQQSIDGYVGLGIGRQRVVVEVGRENAGGGRGGKAISGALGD